MVVGNSVWDAFSELVAPTPEEVCKKKLDAYFQNEYVLRAVNRLYDVVVSQRKDRDSEVQLDVVVPKKRVFGAEWTFYVTVLLSENGFFDFRFQGERLADSYRVSLGGVRYEVSNGCVVYRSNGVSRHHEEFYMHFGGESIVYDLMGVEVK